MPIAERKREEGENAEEQSYTYYEQCKTPAGWLKLGTVNALFSFYILHSILKCLLFLFEILCLHFPPGDCVYVRSDEDRPYIALIEKLWSDKE